MYLRIQKYLTPHFRICLTSCTMLLYAVCWLASLVTYSSMLAQPKGFTDDPYVDDEKFIEKGDG